MSLKFCCDIHIVGSDFGINIMNLSCLIWTILAAGGGMMVSGILSYLSMI